MGFSIRWLAVRGKPADQVLAALRFRFSGETESVAEGKATSIRLPSNWFLILFNDFDDPHMCPQIYSKLSEEAEVVTCAVEEHCMFSAASYWRNGAEVWNVEHNSDHSIEHLEVYGEAPDFFAGIRDEWMKKQRLAKPEFQGLIADYIFEVPVKLAQHMTGFAHNLPDTHVTTETSLGDEPFELVEPRPAGPFVRM